MPNYLFKKPVQSIAQKRKKCLLRWEVTSKCGINCKHCSLGKDPHRPDLPYDKCLKILGLFRDFLREYDYEGYVSFTGGDPLLRADFLDILSVAEVYHQAGLIKGIGIQGNPTYVDEKMAGRLRAAGDTYYNLSIDGLEATHDSIRQPGSFRQAINGLRHLKAAGISTSANFTLWQLNAPELLDVIRLMVAEKVDNFAFSTLHHIGRARDLENGYYPPDEYRRIMIEVLNFLDSLPAEYAHFRDSILRREDIYALLFYELGRLKEYEELLGRWGGPHGGPTKGLIFTVLPDGIVYLRRLIPIKIGQLPDDSFRKIYESSDLLRSYEEESYVQKKKSANEKCSRCPVIEYCGHRVAGPYISSGALYGPDPMCWVKHHKKD